MNEVKVTNVGRRTRDRLGIKFIPEQEETLSVNNRQLLTLRAVKDFKVEVPEEPEGEEELNYSDLNMDEVLKAIEDGKITVDKAIAKEVAGKNRTTLLDKLEENK